jgi:acyl carrier protein
MWHPSPLYIYRMRHPSLLPPHPCTASSPHLLQSVSSISQQAASARLTDRQIDRQKQDKLSHSALQESMLRSTRAVGRAFLRSHRCASSGVPAASFLPQEEVASRVTAVIKSLKYSPPTFPADAAFVSDLGFDSLIVKDLIVRLEDEFCVEVPADAAKAFVSVAPVVGFFASHPKAR